MRIIHLFIGLSCILLACDNPAIQNEREIENLYFDLHTYLQNWIAQVPKSATIQMRVELQDEIHENHIEREMLTDHLKSFDMYYIHKNDDPELYLKESSISSGKESIVYSPQKEKLKVKAFRVFKTEAKIDQIEIDYVHNSLIGSSIHNVVITPAHIQLTRRDEYRLSSELTTVITYSWE